MTTTSSTSNSNYVTLAQAAASTTKTTKATSGLTADDFMKLLIDQLKNQDPSQPMSESDMANQMAQMATISQLEALSTAMTSLSSSDQKLSATSMLDKMVTYSDSNGTSVQGKVKSVIFSGNDVMLDLGTSQISLSDVTNVSDGS